MSDNAMRPGGLPALPDMAALAKAMGRTERSLSWLAFRGEPAKRVHYHNHTVPKDEFRVRSLMTPHRELAKAQDWILRSILDCVPPDIACHSYTKGRSIKTHAIHHVRKDAVIRVDLQDFFGHCWYPKVLRVFTSLGYHYRVAVALAQLCCESPRHPVRTEKGVRYEALEPPSLPQGACTSPALSNLVGRGLDERLRSLASRMGYAYSRYSDDMVFSGVESQWRVVPSLLSVFVGQECRREGFPVNRAKTKVYPEWGQQLVCGVLVNDHPTLSQEDKKLTRAKIHGFVKAAASPRKSAPLWSEIDHVNGKLAWLSLYEPHLASRLKLQLEAALRKLPHPRKG